MPVVIVEWLEGRTVDQKRQLARVITEAMQEIANVKPDGLHIIFHDVPRESWSQGDKLFSDRTPASGTRS